MTQRAKYECFPGDVINLQILYIKYFRKISHVEALSLCKFHQQNERGKKRAYDERIQEVEHGEKNT